MTEAILAEMLAKHPGAREEDVRVSTGLRPVDPGAAVQVQAEAVRTAIISFPKGSAGGMSGLRPQHLQDALVPGMQYELLRQTTAVANLALKGTMPQEIRPWFCGAKLVALPKPEGGSPAGRGGGGHA